MRKLLILVVLVLVGGAVYYFGNASFRKYLEPGSPEFYAEAAKSRVRAVLEGWAGNSKPNFGPADQYALSQWAKGKIVLDRDAMSVYSDRWDQFRQAKKLYRNINDYEVLAVRVDKSADVQTAIVDIKIEGQPYTWIVKKDEPIAWAD